MKRRLTHLKTLEDPTVIYCDDQGADNVEATDRIDACDCPACLEWAHIEARHRELDLEKQMAAIDTGDDESDGALEFPDGGGW